MGADQDTYIVTNAVIRGSRHPIVRCQIYSGSAFIMKALINDGRDCWRHHWIKIRTAADYDQALPSLQ
jgi:hypothetical protein